MAEITYLFGAGASYGAVPIVNEIPDRLQKQINYLDHPNSRLYAIEFFPEFNKVILPLSKMEYQDDLISDLKWLLAESKRHASIDTFAKKLFLKKENDNLNKLKIALSVFFVFEQAMNPTNDRYDSFFASVLDRDMKIPENIKILSWNYDYQFEKAYSEYSNETDIAILHGRLNIHSKNIKSDYNFSIFKINGTTTIYNDNPRGGFNLAYDISESISKNVIEQVVLSHAVMKNSKSHWQTFSFAWENNYADSN